MQPPIQLVSRSLQNALNRVAEDLHQHEHKVIDAYQGVNAAIETYNMAIERHNVSVELALSVAERLSAVINSNVDHLKAQGADPEQIEYCIECLMRFTGSLGALKSLPARIDDPFHDFQSEFTERPSEVLSSIPLWSSVKS